MCCVHCRHIVYLRETWTAKCALAVDRIWNHCGNEVLFITGSSHHSLYYYYYRSDYCSTANLRRADSLQSVFLFLYTEVHPSVRSSVIVIIVHNNNIMYYYSITKYDSIMCNARPGLKYNIIIIVIILCTGPVTPSSGFIRFSKRPPWIIQRRHGNEVLYIGIYPAVPAVYVAATGQIKIICHL